MYQDQCAKTYQARLDATRVHELLDLHDWRHPALCQGTPLQTACMLEPSAMAFGSFKTPNTEIEHPDQAKGKRRVMKQTRALGHALRH